MHFAASSISAAQADHYLAGSNSTFYTKTSLINKRMRTTKAQIAAQAEQRLEFVFFSVDLLFLYPNFEAYETKNKGAYQTCIRTRGRLCKVTAFVVFSNEFNCLGPFIFIFVAA